MCTFEELSIYLIIWPDFTCRSEDWHSLARGQRGNILAFSLRQKERRETISIWYLLFPWRFYKPAWRNIIAYFSPVKNHQSWLVSLSFIQEKTRKISRLNVCHIEEVTRTSDESEIDFVELTYILMRLARNNNQSTRSNVWQTLLIQDMFNPMRLKGWAIFALKIRWTSAKS